MKKNILFVSDDFSPSKTGVGIYLQNIARGLASRGYDVTVVTTRCQNEKINEVPGVRIIRVFTVVLAGFPQALPSRSCVKGIVLKYRPDIIHYHYFGIMMLTMISIARELKIPQTLTYHFSLNVLTQVWFMKAFRALINRAVEKTYAKLDLIIAPSVGTYEELKTSDYASKLSYIAQPVDLVEIDITRFWDKKVTAMKKYESQTKIFFTNEQGQTEIPRRSIERYWKVQPSIQEP